jgi:acetyl esterase
MRFVVFALLIGVMTANSSRGQDSDQPRGKAGNTLAKTILGEAESVIYRKTPEAELKMFIMKPTGWKASDKRPAIVFFFGGGWMNGAPTQFASHAKHLAELGMVTCCADYRTASKHKTKAVECVRDAKAAVAYIRAHAAELGVDPNRIAAGGGSAGGHLAGCTGLVPGYNESNSDVSSVPNALILFNPALVLDNVPGMPELNDKNLEDFKSRMGDVPNRLSPFHHISANQPPAIIFHGTADDAVAYAGIKRFSEDYQKAGNHCELVTFEGREHGFFNLGRGDNSDYEKTLKDVDAFLKSLGYVQ